MDNKNTNSIAMQYAADVISGKVITGKLVKLAVKRHLDDLENGHKRGLYFDEKAAQHAIDFFQYLKHVKDSLAGSVIKLEPFQQFRLWCLFGWMKNSGKRRFRYAYNSVARKNGKTTEASGIGIYLLLAGGVKGAEVYSCATKKDQAKICFDIASQQVAASSLLRKRIGVSKSSLYVLKTASKMQALASGADTLDGLSPSAVILDEFHAHKDHGALYEVLKSGMGSRETSLMYIITTAGFNKESACYKLRKTCIDILEGHKTDDSMFVLIYTLDDEDDWTDEKNWVKSNPNNGVSINKEYLSQEFNQAINTPSQQVNFKTKHLNIWTDSSMSWIESILWDKCNKGGNPSDLKGRVCYAGLDLAATRDFNAFVLLFPDSDGQNFDVICHFWVPEARAAEKNSSADYNLWAAEGSVNLTEGNIVDQRYLMSDIVKICMQYQVKSIAFDRYLAYNGLIQGLMEEGLPLEEFGQGFVSMSEPTKQLERLVCTERINHFGNPVLRWMNSNIELKIDPAGGIKIDKGKSANKVDGMVALVMAIGTHMLPLDESIYNTRGIRTLE
tara:strand:+ start:417 stop:2090 length:1674 start_codon:yes stop_codon:yes gene_type:complete